MTLPVPNDACRMWRGVCTHHLTRVPEWGLPLAVALPDLLS